MKNSPLNDQQPSKRVPPRALTWWYGLMAIGGLAFGVYADKQPFGEDILAHPLVVFFILVGVALLALRFALARPVPEIIPERSLLIGCFIGLATFLIGNWFGIYLLAVR